MEIQNDKNKYIRRKPMVWTRNLTLKLIKLYESHSNLWDVSTNSYKNRLMRKLSMDEISNVMGISVKELNKKIHNLRCQFQSNHRKFSNTSDNLSVKWEFYDALKFIIVKDGYNDTIDSLKKEHNENIDAHNYDFLQMHVENINKTSPVSYSLCEDSVSSLLSQVTTPIKVETSFRPIQFETPPHFVNRSDQKRKRCLEQELLLNQCYGIRSNPADSFQIFSDYIADELRTMSSKASDLQSLAKRKIQRVILEMNDMYDERFPVHDNIVSSVPIISEISGNALQPECEQ